MHNRILGDDAICRFCKEEEEISCAALLRRPGEDKVSSTEFR